MTTSFLNINKTKKTTHTFDKPGNYVAFFYNLSGDFVFNIASEKVTLDIYGLFHGKKTEKFVIKTKQHHAAPNSTSNLLVKGVFDGDTSFHYEGLIKIEKEGEGTHAYQKNQNIILSPNVYIRSEPFLEILANEVFCTHGSTTGKLSENEMHYLATRNITQEQAKNLLIKGFLNEIVERVRRYDSKLNLRQYD